MKQSCFSFARWLIAFALGFFSSASWEHAASAAPRDRTLSLYNIHTEEKITVTFKRDGKYIQSGLKQLNRFMRDWRKNSEIAIDPALIDLMWELHDELGSTQPIHLICGYRSSETNETLRLAGGGQARASRHVTGQAADMMFPDIPLKQLRYSALIRERGGVGFYPASGIPFVHVDTGNVRHWPRVNRTELAVLFPGGHSKHVPSDGRPLTPADSHIALASWRANGLELPWALSKKTARPMLASLTPAEMPFGLRNGGASHASEPPLPPPDEKPLRNSIPNSGGSAEIPEAQLAVEGDEQQDDIAFEPLPATFLLAEKPLSYSDLPDPQPRDPVFTKITLLMSPPSVLASDEFERRLQMAELYQSRQFKGSAFTMNAWRRSKFAAVSPVRPSAVK